MQWLLQKTGLSRPAGGGEGDGDDDGALVPPQQPEVAVPAAASKDQGPPGEYPSDVPWDENPCLSCNSPCTAHKQACGEACLHACNMHMAAWLHVAMHPRLHG
eukprot:364637-Chlamydomonas_euryale.AAC.13